MNDSQSHGSEAGAAATTPTPGTELAVEDEAPLAEIRILTPVSIVVPTFRERENLPHLVARVDEVRRRFDLELELLLMDDDSRDGTEEWVRDHAPAWVRLVVREHDRGLSPAVVDGLAAARHPVVVVMDADLSHPPEKIPDMVLALQSGQQLVIGSRYVPGGSTDDDWGFFRWLNSKVATLLARPFTAAKDPMAGFFAMRRSDFARARELNPIGYKIGLELIVKCGLENVGEVPIHFTDRVHGESKLSLREQLNYLLHLRRLYLFKYATFTSVVQFALVGTAGVVVNLGVVTLVVALGLSPFLALAAGVGASLVSNFFLNRLTGFRYSRARTLWTQFLGFLRASAVAAVIQLAVASLLLRGQPGLAPQLAALAGIAAGLLVNFTVNRYFVFKAKHPARRRTP